MKYWLVEITLTSGKGLQFYVPATERKFAIEKANEYADMAEGNKKLTEIYSMFRRRP